MNFQFILIIMIYFILPIYFTEFKQLNTWKLDECSVKMDMVSCKITKPEITLA